MRIPPRERIVEVFVGFMTKVGMALPIAWVLSIGLSDISGYFARLDVVGWLLDFAMLLSVPWEIIATVLIIIRWRDLPQRFWITYCTNGILAYYSLPLYLFHFGIYRW